MAFTARADTLQAPIGGRPIAVGEGRVACGPLAEGWNIEAGGRSVRPPRAEASIGHAVSVKVGATLAGCEQGETFVTLVATRRWPVFDLFSIVFSPDEGRLEAKGQHLAGVSIRWTTPSDAGTDACRDPETEGGSDRCWWGVSRDAPADPAKVSFRWLPDGARGGADVFTFDAEGRPAAAEAFVLRPARVVISRLVPADPTVDLATGQGELPLIHPEAVASAECGNLRCEMVNGKLIVSGASSVVNTLEVKLHLIPHVTLAKRDGSDSQASAKYAVLHCPMSIASGPPIRHNDEAKLVVKLDGRCAHDLGSVRFLLGDTQLKQLRVVSEHDSSYVLLRLGNIADEVVTVTAVRGQVQQIVLAVARTPTRIAPNARTTLELPGFPNLSFIPTNRPARVHVSAAGEHQHFGVVPVEGVYTVHSSAGVDSLQADPNAAGLAQIELGLRADTLPAGLNQVDLAVLKDPLQRDIREANIPAPIGATFPGKDPLIEMLCGGGPVPLERLTPGVTAHLPFSLRDTCRVVFHRERLLREYGTQKLNFEIEIISPDGAARGEGHVSEIIIFRAGPAPRYAWIHGVITPFDRVVVRVSHAADENHYIGASEITTGAPAAQWSLVLGTGRARLYGTTTIPTGLYRFGDRRYSGVLSLNFGVISRLTWLDAEGHEGFLAAEAGVLVIGLANSKSQSGESLTQIGAVLGLGVAVPIANRATVTQASINLHAWLEADISHTSGASRYAFIFGPSISIGNVGTNL